MFYKCIKQYDSSDCGCACLASIARYYGNNISLSEIINEAHITDEGMNLLELVNVAEKIGFDAVPMKRAEDFNSADISLPCIAHVMLEDGRFHFIVIYKIGKRNVTIADPSMGITKIDKQKFFESALEENVNHIWTGILVFFTLNEQTKIKNKVNYRKSIIGEIISLEKKNLFLIMLLSIISMSFKVIGSLYYRIILDIIIPNKWEYSLYFITLIFVVIQIVSIYMDKVSVNKVLDASREINNELTINYFKHILRLPLSFHDVRKNGEIISRFQDIDKIQKVLLSSTMSLPADFLFIIIISIILICKCIPIFCVVVCMCVAYITIILFYRKKFDQHNTREMVEESKVTTQLVDVLEGISTIKAFDIDKKLIVGGKKKITDWQKAIFDLGNVENWQAAFNALISGMGELFILGYGAYAVMKGIMTIGELITYNVLIGYLLKPIRNIIGLQPQFHTAYIALGRLKTILDIKEEEQIDRKIKVIKNIESRHVSFGYSPYRKIVNDISFSIDKYNKIAMVGNSGSGKTTIAKLLTQMYLPCEGEIFFNGIAGDKIDSKSIRHNILYVSQEDFIFSGSIKENLVLDDDSISQEEVINMCKQIGLHDFISNMRCQYETILEERGSNLSKGQRQKIAITRALLKKPRILILDEATSNIDVIGEQQILHYIKSIEDLTLIVITHRINNIKDSDLIYVLEQGQIIAQGKHCELENRCALYRQYLVESDN